MYLSFNLIKLFWCCQGLPTLEQYWMNGNINFFWSTKVVTKKKNNIYVVSSIRYATKYILYQSKWIYHVMLLNTECIAPSEISKKVLIIRIKI